MARLASTPLSSFPIEPGTPSFPYLVNVSAAKQRSGGPFPSNHLNPDEGSLARRWQAGEPEAFEAVYRQHAPRIFSLASRMGGSPETGEDLLQEIFLQAHRKRSSFKGDASIGTWLYRLALNHCLDFVRSRAAKMEAVTDALDGDGLGEPAARRETPVLRLDLERAIEKLPAGSREAFVLHDVEGFEHREVAAMLGIAEGTSRSQVFKARMKLRALLRR
jgi:RNA polymerase sigma-70 factor, ECF subfamily